MGNNITPGQNPGEFLIPPSAMPQVAKVTVWTPESVYDSEIIPAGAVALNTSLRFFFNSTQFQLPVPAVPKTTLHTSMNQQNRLDQEWIFKAFGVHVAVRPAGAAVPGAVDFNDAVNCLCRGYFRLTTGNSKEEAKGPAWFFPGPYGLTGSLALDGALGPVQQAMVNNGMPTIANVKDDPFIIIKNGSTFDATITFQEAWTANALLMVYVYLYGWMGRPAT
jgi:hypothetical protein